MPQPPDLTLFPHVERTKPYYFSSIYPEIRVTIALAPVT